VVVVRSSGKKSNGGRCVMDELEVRLQNATSEEELISVLALIESADDNVTGSLQQLVSTGRQARSHSLKRLELLRTQLATALNISRDLSSTLGSTAFVATRISSKVRNIDTEHSRVKQALKYVEDVMALKSNILGIQDAMDTRDWERAANYVHKAMSLPSDLINGEFANKMVPTSEIPDYPADTLAKARDSLSSLFTREFERASKVRDMENVSRYFKLFPLIGHESQGLDIYGKFICGIITAQSRQLIQSRSSEGSKLYGLAMSRLFENIAAIVSQHAPIVEKHYGKGRMIRVVDKIQIEADSQGGLIIDTFWDECRIDKTVSEIRGYAYSYLVSSFSRVAITRTGSPVDPTPRRSEDEGVDLKEVASYVHEMSVMLNRWALYRSFLASRWQDFIDPEPSVTWNMPDLIVNNSMFAKKVSTKISPAFESLAVFVFRRSIEKAFQLEELPDLKQRFTQESPLTTSVVDDVMYILNTLSQQLLSTGETPLIKNLIANFRRILESDFVGMIQRKLRDEAPKQQLSGTPARVATPQGQRRVMSGFESWTSSLGGLTGNDERRLRIFLVYMNNLSVCSGYTERILNSMDMKPIVAFEDDVEAVRDALNSLASNFRARCSDLINDGAQVVFSTVINSRLRTICSAAFKDADYMLSPSEGSDATFTDMSATFGHGWKSLMTGFSRMLSPENYYRLLSIVATSLSRILEKWIWSLEGKVNELGVIRLDRDISKIIASLSEGRYKVRDRFVRVAQIVMIIGLDEQEDEQEDIEWTLTDEERQKARFIRVDRRAARY
jgi:hypothetical protein